MCRKLGKKHSNYINPADSLKRHKYERASMSHMMLRDLYTYRQLCDSTLLRDALMCPQQNMFDPSKLHSAKRRRYLKAERYWLNSFGGKWRKACRMESSLMARPFDPHIFKVVNSLVVDRVTKKS